MNTEKNSKVIKPNFGRVARAQRTGKEQKTKKQLLEEIEAIRQRLVQLEYFADSEKGNGDIPVRNDGSHNIAFQEEIDKHTKTESAAEESKNLLHLIYNLSTNFIYLPSDEIDSGINDVLSIIGQYSDVDRSHVFLLDESNTKISNTHEWCAYGVEPFIEKMQNISEDDLPWFFHRMRNLEITHIPDIEDLPPEAAKEKKEWLNQHIKSLICVPIVNGFTLIGFLGFDSVRAQKTWTDDMVLLIRMMAGFFASAFVQRKTEEKLQEGAQRYKTLFEYANDSIFLIKDGIFIDCNSQTLRLFKCSREEIVGSSPHEFSPAVQPDGKQSDKKSAERIEAALAGKPQFFEWRHCTLDGDLFDADVSLNKIELGDEILIQAIVRDVTVRKKWEQAMKESEERYRSLFDDSRDAIYITRKDGSFVDMNESFVNLFGFTRQEALKLNAKMAYVTPEDQENFKEVIKEKGYTKDFGIKLKKRDGGIMDCLVTVMAKRNEKEQITGYQGIIRDITATKQAEETIRHMAYHDALTGLPNRILFNDRLTMAVANAQRGEKNAAVMMLDLDKFKQVNDVLGHKIGDLLLKAVAERLTKTLRRSDTVARMGGDEFMIILPEIAHEHDAGLVAEKIIAVFQHPFRLETKELSVTTSVGVSIFPKDGADTDTLVKNADIAMYCSKGFGRNKHTCYSPKMSENIGKKKEPR